MRKLACVVLALCACKPSDPKDPQTWIARLNDSDVKARIDAVQRLRKLKAKTAASQIAELLRDPMAKEEAALALQDLGGPAEVPALIEAIDTTVGAGSDQATRLTNRTNAKVADALGAIGDPRAGPSLLRLARSKDDMVRLASVQALGKARFKQAVHELSLIVDDEAAPPVLVKKSIIALGEIGDPGAIPALEHGLVVERQGVSFLPESSYALFLLGPAAVEPMMKLALDQDPQYLAWARENSRAPAGTYAKAALVLGDLEDPRAIPVLLAKLKYADPDPNPGTARLLSNLVRQFAAGALGRLRAREAAAPILALVQTKDPQDEDVVTAASEALVSIGEPATARELAKRAQSGAIRSRLLAAQGAALYGESPVARDLVAIAAKEAKGSAASCQRQLAELQLPADDAATACDLLASQFGALADRPFLAAQKCAGAPACWAVNLDDKDPVVRARAAYELGRGGVVPAVPALGKAAGDATVLVRVAAIRALDWLLSVADARPLLKALAPQIGAQLAAEQGHVQTVRVNEELRRLHTRLLLL